MQVHWNNYCAMSIVNFMAFPETSGGQGPIVESVRTIAEDSFFERLKSPGLRMHGPPGGAPDIADKSVETGILRTPCYSLAKAEPE